MKGITIEEVKALQHETGEGLVACKKILIDRYHSQERSEMMLKVRELSFTDRKTERLVKELFEYLVRNS